jgi:hypothetical protein
MIVLLATIVFGLFFGIFATQNTGGVTLYLGSYILPNLPIFYIVLGAFFIGVASAWFLSLFHSFSTFFILRRKENTIRELKKTTGELIRRVHQLELEIVKTKDPAAKKIDEDAL